MISMWALMSERDVEAYAATLILPPHLAHLRLEPFHFASQAENCDGQEALRLTYVGEGRLEEHALGPEEHALGMIRFVCAGIDASRIHLPRDDARWHWTTAADPPEAMRIYFAPTVQSLGKGAVPSSPAKAYVSVSRGHVFVGRAVVEAYLQAWIEFLHVEGATDALEMGTPSGGIEFAAGSVGGEVFLSDDAIAEDLMRFAGLNTALAHLDALVEPDLDSATQGKCGIFEDGVYIGLSRRDEPSERIDRTGRLPDRT